MWDILCCVWPALLWGLPYKWALYYADTGELVPNSEAMRRGTTLRELDPVPRQIVMHSDATSQAYLQSTGPEHVLDVELTPVRWSPEREQGPQVEQALYLHKLESARDANRDDTYLAVQEGMVRRAARGSTAGREVYCNVYETREKHESPAAAVAEPATPVWTAKMPKVSAMWFVSPSEHVSSSTKTCVPEAVVPAGPSRLWDGSPPLAVCMPPKTAGGTEKTLSVKPTSYGLCVTALGVLIAS